VRVKLKNLRLFFPTKLVQITNGQLLLLFTGFFSVASYRVINLTQRSSSTKEIKTVTWGKKVSYLKLKFSACQKISWKRNGILTEI
jgi:hypothetical protein